jgi:hypothetical protein
MSDTDQRPADDHSFPPEWLRPEQRPTKEDHDTEQWNQRLNSLKPGVLGYTQPEPPPGEYPSEWRRS